MKTTHLPLISLLLIAFSFVFIVPSCKRAEEIIAENPNPLPVTNPDKSIKTVTEDGGYICTYEQTSADTLKLTFDNGNVYSCSLLDDKIKTIDLSTGSSVSCSYNSDGLLSQFERDFGGYKIVNKCSYTNGFISEVEGVTSIKQSDDSYKDETTFKYLNIIAGDDGLKSCSYETYIGGSPSQVFDVSFSCSEKDNTLYQSATHCSLIEFTDYFNNLFYYSTKCVESVLIEDQGSSNSYTVKYGCQWNSDNQLIELDIDHPAKQVKRTYTYVQ